MTAASSGSAVRVTDEHGARQIRFDRPESLNALRPADIRAATAAVTGIPDACRAVVFTGTGQRAFSTGMHLDNFVDLTPASARTLISELAEFLTAVRTTPVVTVASVHGHCLGAAFELALACDLRIATTDARFGLPEIKLGIPSVIDAALLQSYVGLALAKEMVLTGDTRSAAELRDSGILNRVVAPADLESETASLRDAAARHTRTAVASQKRLLETWQNTGLAEAITASVDEFAAVFEHDETHRRITAYRRERSDRHTRGETRG